MNSLELVDAPRLYVNPDIVENLSESLHSPFLKTSAKRVLRDADWLVDLPPITEAETPSYLGCGRMIRTHIECLTAAWILTRDRKYRRAGIKHLGNLTKWNQISCEASPARPDKQPFYCLMYGEYSAAIGLMYDIFRPDMTSAEQKVFFAVFDKHLLREAVRCLTVPPWWVGKEWSNWNAVCSGGMGILALAVYDDHPDAPQLIPFVEKSLKPYFRSYVKYGGGNEEGTGYWNYGMNHAMRYVLSWENSTCKKHPALRIKELGKTLYFPTDFQGLTFGDNDGWHPTSFYFMLAKRMNEHHAALRGATFLPDEVDVEGPRRQRYVDNGDLLYAAAYIPPVEEIAHFKKQHKKTREPVARIYEGLDWAMLADDEVSPKLRMAIRGGECHAGGHSFADLLSFRCRVNGELMIADQEDTGYLLSTFGPRGSDIYSRGPASKSTLFVEGLGCGVSAKCDVTEIVEGQGCIGVRIDATGIYMRRRRYVKCICRLFLFVDNKYWLVIDHVLGRDFATHLGIESRFHTHAECKVNATHASLKSGKERLQMTFAALQPGVILESRGTPPRPAKKEPTKILRWLGEKRVEDNLHVVGLRPGNRKLKIELSKDEDVYVINSSYAGGKQHEIRVNSKLELVGAE